MRRRRDRLKERLSKPDGRAPEATAWRWAHRDEHTRQVLHAVATCDVELECGHGYLPGDPNPTCGCWEGLSVREAEALRHDIQNLTKKLERHQDEVQAIHTAIRALTEMLGHVDRNVTAVGFQVSKAGDNGR